MRLFFYKSCNQSLYCSLIMEDIYDPVVVMIKLFKCMIRACMCNNLNGELVGFFMITMGFFFAQFRELIKNTN